jgi:large subunit ribosomal protein L22
MKAYLANYHQSPRKVRLVATLIKGKKVNEAMTELDFVSKRASLPIKQLIASAVANAKNNFDLNKDDLYIKELRIDKGIVMRRMVPGARGRGYPLKLRTSHVSVLLDIKGEEKKTKGKKVKVEKVEKVEKVKAEKPKAAKKVTTKTKTAKK